MKKHLARLIARLLTFLRPFYDTRILLLFGLCGGIGLLVDPAATLGLAGYMAYVIGMWGAALMLTKILMPYLSTSQLARSALDSGNVAAALVLLARTLLLMVIAVTFMFWGK